jgi:hypothetical protein
MARLDSASPTSAVSPKWKSCSGWSASATVSENDPVAEVEADKAVVTMPAGDRDDRAVPAQPGERVESDRSSGARRRRYGRRHARRPAGAGAGPDARRRQREDVVRRAASAACRRRRRHASSRASSRRPRAVRARVAAAHHHGRCESARGGRPGRSSRCVRADRRRRAGAGAQRAPANRRRDDCVGARDRTSADSRARRQALGAAYDRRPAAAEQGVRLTYCRSS